MDFHSGAHSSRYAETREVVGSCISQCPFSHCECFRFYSEMQILSRGMTSAVLYSGEFYLLVESKLWVRKSGLPGRGLKHLSAQEVLSGLNNCVGEGVSSVCFIGYT